MKVDYERFFRRLRLKAHFHQTSEHTNGEAHDNQLNDTIASNSSDNTNHQQDSVTSGFLESLKPRQSKWTPPPGQFTAVDHYIDRCRREVNQIDFERRLTRHNLTYDEQRALRKLRSRTDVVIRQADKGGAFVVWRTDLYIAEANRQLTDERFYKKIPSDATHSSQQEVKTFITTAIASNQLPPSATNLIVEHPRTSKFYLLPKIHKPGNPGRPIVSACSCPTELLAVYLDHLTTPFVRSRDSYVKDTTHMLNILDSLRLRDGDGQRLIFTMDIKSLYTVIPNDGGFRALQYYFDKREILEPPTDTLLRMAELVLTLNTFEFNGEFYKQTGGVAMGSRLGPNYACLFVGYVEVRMLSSYTGIKPDLYKRYMDNVAGAASCGEEDLRQFLACASPLHPSLEYIWSVSSGKLPFLDIYMKPRADRIATSIHYKDTYSHSYFNFSSSHKSCKSSIPFSQFLRI